MKIHLAYVSLRGARAKLPGIRELMQEFTGRMARYCQFAAREYASERAFLAALPGRTLPFLAMLDEKGREFSSLDLARFIAARQQETQHLVFAVGPPDGWSSEARSRADVLLSLGPMTLQHELARAVLLEQLYRAFTILSGHPYHREGR